MGQKFHVQAVTRAGHDGAWRAGRKWPSGSPTPIEVVDHEEDPPHDPAKGIVVGKKTYGVLKADPNLTLRAPGDPLETAKDHEALVAQVAELKAKLAKYEGTHPEALRDGPSTEGVMTEGEAKSKRR